MIEVDDRGYERFYFDLSEDERAKAMKKCVELGVAFLHSDEEPDWIALVGATPEQVASFDETMGLKEGGV